LKYLIIGGAGFIGSYIAEYVIELSNTAEVIIYDNFTSGKMWHLSKLIGNKKLKILNKDIYDEDIFFEASQGVDVAILLAANPDIARAALEPDIDFHQGTALTQIVLEALRKGECKRLLYASGSGVYGDIGNIAADEDHSPMRPISTYGASKLGCEALISSYCHMFGLTASAFRFGNVVGGRQTHGVAYDFIRRLSLNPYSLKILGDGEQSKPYIHVCDVIEAMFLVLKKQKSIFDVYNVAPNSFSSVREIASSVITLMGGDHNSCLIECDSADRGWKGDVPIVRLNSQKIRNLGWTETKSSAEAVNLSIKEMLANIDNILMNEKI